MNKEDVEGFIKYLQEYGQDGLEVVFGSCRDSASAVTEYIRFVPSHAYNNLSALPTKEYIIKVTTNKDL